MNNPGIQVIWNVVMEVPDLRLSPGIICVRGVIHVAFVYYPWGKSSEGALMGLHKLLEKLQQKKAKMTSSVAHAEYENQVHQMCFIAMARTGTS